MSRTYNVFSMITTNLLTAIRGFLRNRFSILVNLFGLAAGFCCVIYITLYAIDEYGYDRFHEHAENIYRFNTRFGPQNERVPLGPYRLDDHITQNIPGLKETTRIRPGNLMYLWLTDRQQIHIDKGILLADSNFFSFFSFPLHEGHPDQVLQDHHSMVIDRSTAKRLFGEIDPIGQVLYLQGEHPVHISGIMEDMPRQSHFRASTILNVETIRRFAPEFIFTNYGSFGFHYYLLLEPQTDPLMVAESINMIMEDVSAELAEITHFDLQALLDIRLKSERIAWDIDAHGKKSLLVGLIAIAVIILMLASVNYINLYTALSTRRKVEIGIRKALGATRNHIFWQSMTESLITVVMAVVIAFGLAELFLPVIKELSGKPLSISWLLAANVWPWIIIVSGGVALLAGFYPAMILGRFQPADILRGGSMGNPSKRLWGQNTNLRVRQALIVFQFACTTALIVISLSVTRQINYMLSVDPGYDQHGLFLVQNPYNEQQKNRYERFKQSLEQYPSIEVVSAGMSIPTERIGNFTGIKLHDKDDEIQCGQINVDKDYFHAVGAKLLAGRYFSKEYGMEQEHIIINKTAARALGYSNPPDIINQEIITSIIEGNLRIIGVIEDIHYYSLHELITPVLYTNGPYQPYHGNILVRSIPGQLNQALSAAEATWNQENIFYPFDHAIIETRNRDLYQREEHTRQILLLFVGLAMAVSLMGLFALSSFMMVSRVKEIAVRKVLGAGNKQILMMLAREFSLLIILSSIIAWPFAWLATDSWLNNFAYRQDIYLVYFLLASVLSLLAAWLTITYHGVKASATNPASALKYVS